MRDRKAASMLRQFPANYMRAQEVLQELRGMRLMLDVAAQRYGGFPSSGGYSDPTARLNEKVFWLQDVLKSLEAQTIPVLRLRSRLKRSSSNADQEEYLVMELCYFNQMQVSDVALHLQKSRRSIERIKHQVILDLKEEIGKFSKSE